MKFVHKRRIQAVGQDCQGFGYALILEFLCKVVRGDNDMLGMVCLADHHAPHASGEASASVGCLFKADGRAWHKMFVHPRQPYAGDVGHWQYIAHIGVDTRVHGLHQRNVEDFAGPYAGEGGTHFAMNVDYVDVTEFFDAGYPCVDDLARWPTERVPVWFDDAAGGQANHGGVITGFVKRTENRNRVSSCFQGVLLRLDRGLNTTQCWQVVISEHGYMHEPHYTVYEGTAAYKKSEVLWCLGIDVLLVTECFYGFGVHCQ